MRLTGSRQANYLLALLLLVNLALIALGSVKVFTTGNIAQIEALNLGRDRGYGEIFMYVQELTIVVLLALLAVSRRKIIYLSWMAVFSYILIDDSMRLHERSGRWLTERFGLEPWLGLRAIDIGELVYSLAVLCLVVAVIAWPYRIYSDAEGRTFTRYMSICVLLLGICGVAIDMFDMIFDYRIFHLMEDGGEMLAISLTLLFTVSWAADNAEPASDVRAGEVVTVE